MRFHRPNKHVLHVNIRLKLDNFLLFFSVQVLLKSFFSNTALFYNISNINI